MTSQYEDAVEVLARNAALRYELEHPPAEGEQVSWRDFADDARADLDQLAEVGALNLYLVKEMRAYHAARIGRA